MIELMFASGSHWPWHKGHDAPQPSPDPVLVTRAPARSTANMPTTETQISPLRPLDISNCPLRVNQLARPKDAQVKPRRSTCAEHFRFAMLFSPRRPASSHKRPESSPPSAAVYGR